MENHKAQQESGNLQLSRDTLALIRTSMSMNRTLLAFLRTGLSLIGAGIAAYKLFEFQYREIVFALLCVAGVGMIVVGAVVRIRARRLYRRIRPDDLIRLEDRVGSNLLD